MFDFHPLLSSPKLTKTGASLLPSPTACFPGAIGRLRNFGSSCHLQSLQVQYMELLRVPRVGRFDDPTSKANGRGQHVDLQTLEPSPLLPDHTTRQHTCSASLPATKSSDPPLFSIWLGPNDPKAPGASAPSTSRPLGRPAGYGGHNSQTKLDANPKFPPAEATWLCPYFHT